MKVQRLEIPEVMLLEPKVFGDGRGSFVEAYNRRTFREATGLEVDFVQDNQSLSVRNVLRGLHYQVRQPQGKLVSVLVGQIFDVAVDLRRSSPTFRKCVSVQLSAGTPRTIWVPPGFAHGFLVLSEQAIVQYKTTDYYAPEHERTLLWNDPELAIRWPLEAEPVMSDKDRHGARLGAADLFD
jgi:dTDP-4-dehydrorhamnose 3,5-epimerase